LCDALSEIAGHTDTDDRKRVAISNQIAGVDGFVALLQRAVYFKNRVVNLQQGAVDPAQNDTQG
jgi:hypothetical protein